MPVMQGQSVGSTAPLLLMQLEGRCGQTEHSVPSSQVPFDVAQVPSLQMQPPAQGRHSKPSSQYPAEVAQVPSVQTQLFRPVQLLLAGQFESGFPQVSVADPSELHCWEEQEVAEAPVFPQLSVQVETEVQVAVVPAEHGQLESALPQESVAEPSELHCMAAQAVAAGPTFPQLSVQVEGELHVAVDASHDECPQLGSGFPQVSVAVPLELHAFAAQALAADPLFPQLSSQVVTLSQVAFELSQVF
jgi:hypothetical protein